MAKTYNGRFELPKAPKKGVGWLIVRGQDVGNMTQIMIGIVAIALTGLLITTLMRVLESKLCAWTVRGK